MSCIGLSSDANEILELFEAEDRVLNTLANLPRLLAVITAVRLAVELYGQWAAHQGEMLLERDNRPGYLATKEELIWLFSSATRYCKDPFWVSCPTADLRRHLARLSSDAAALVAYKVARLVCQQKELGK